MKIRLLLNDKNTDEVRQRLERSGFEIGDDGEYVLTESKPTSDLLAVRDKYGQRLSITKDRVVFIESYGHNVEVHTTDETYFSLDRLYHLSEVLDKRNFIRVSNSAIIARQHVVKIRPSFSMKFILTMSDDSLIDVTRTYYYSFKEFFGI